MPPPLTFADLAILYEENKDKIYMTEKDGVGQHKLNEEGFKNWLEHIKAMHNISGDGSELDTYIKFGEAVFYNTRYVTFPEYMEKIKLMAGEMMELIRVDDLVFFVISGKSSKSNTWVMLLFFGELLKLGLEAYSEKINVISIDREGSSYDLIYYAFYNRDKTISAFHFDDMTYTGSQLSHDISSFCERIMWNVLENISYYIAVPFTTTFATNFLAKKSVKFFKNTETVPTISEIINKYYEGEQVIIDRIKLLCSGEEEFSKKARSDPNTMALKRGHNSFACKYYDNGLAAIYFDHKIADFVSVPSSWFSTGSYPPNIGLNEVTEINSKNDNIYPILSSGPLILSCTNEEQGECYRAFYKKFRYTFNGKVLDPSIGLVYGIVQLKEQKGGKTKRRRFYGRKSIRRR